MSGPATSLVIASYNQVHAMALVLEGVLVQERLPDEIVFADDGSEPDTLALVEAFRARTSIPVTFTTQEDRGFRKAKALNNALRRCRGDLVAFLDGDCIPPRRWLRAHVAGLAKADFTTAGYVLMDLERTRARSPEEIRSGAIDAVITAAERQAFVAHQRRERLYALLRFRKKPKILGGNFACRRAALVAVNGFDEAFENFGKEDSDLRNRLRNSGCRGRSLWDHNWVFHCSHQFDPRRTAPGVWRQDPDLDYYESRRRARRAVRGLVDESAVAGGAAPPLRSTGTP